MSRDDERQAKLAHLTYSRAQGKKAYGDVCEVHPFGQVRASCSDAKEVFCGVSSAHDASFARPAAACRHSRGARGLPRPPRPA
jgi:hypothetical protein